MTGADVSQDGPRFRRLLSSTPALFLRDPVSHPRPSESQHDNDSQSPWKQKSSPYTHIGDHKFLKVGKQVEGETMRPSNHSPPLETAVSKAQKLYRSGRFITAAELKEADR